MDVVHNIGAACHCSEESMHLPWMYIFVVRGEARQQSLGRCHQPMSRDHNTIVSAPTRSERAHILRYMRNNID
jgi:hypothetical protein